jgi:MFS family permease
LYYGWPMLAGLSFAETVSWGIVYYAFSVFIRPMEIELGWSRAQVTGAFSLALLVGGVAAVPVGHWLDAHGPRALMTAGVGGRGRPADRLVARAIARRLLRGVGGSGTGHGRDSLRARFRDRRRLVRPPSPPRAHHPDRLRRPRQHDLRPARRLAPRAAGMAERGRHSRGDPGRGDHPIHSILLRRSPQAIGLGADGDAGAPFEPSAASESVPSAETVRAALGGRAFWLLTSAVVLSGLAAAATVVHFIPFLLGRRFPLSTAAFAAGGIGLMQLPGRLFYIPIRRRMSIFGSTAAVLLVQAFALACLPMVRGRIGLAVFVMAFGMGNGAATLVRATGIAELFDPAVYGRIGGIVALFTAVARASGPIAAALAYQKIGGYGAVFWSLAALLAIARRPFDSRGAHDPARLSHRHPRPSPAPEAAGAAGPHAAQRAVHRANCRTATPSASPAIRFSSSRPRNGLAWSAAAARSYGSRSNGRKTTASGSALPALRA